MSVCSPRWELYSKLPNTPAQNPSPVAYFIDLNFFFLISGLPEPDRL